MVTWCHSFLRAEASLAAVVAMLVHSWLSLLVSYSFSYSTYRSATPYWKASPAVNRRGVLVQGYISIRAV